MNGQESGAASPQDGLGLITPEQLQMMERLSANLARAAWTA